MENLQHNIFIITKIISFFKKNILLKLIFLHLRQKDGVNNINTNLKKCM
jgi:hypothetical protein